MKRTKSMQYKETTESRELFLYIVNDGELYRQAKYIIESLRKKAIKGIYNPDKAVDAWYNLATVGSQQYKKDFGYSFSVQDRFTCATDLEEYYRENLEN